MDKDEVRDILSFMEKVFEMVILWMDLFPSKYMKYYEVYKKHKKTYLVDYNVAIAASGNEIIGILDLCFRSYPRILKMTKNFKFSEEEEKRYALGSQWRRQSLCIAYLMAKW